MTPTTVILEGALSTDQFGPSREDFRVCRLRIDTAAGSALAQPYAGLSPLEEYCSLVSAPLVSLSHQLVLHYTISGDIALTLARSAPHRHLLLAVQT